MSIDAPARIRDAQALRLAHGNGLDHEHREGDALHVLDPRRLKLDLPSDAWDRLAIAAGCSHEQILLASVALAWSRATGRADVKLGVVDRERARHVAVRVAEACTFLDLLASVALPGEAASLDARIGVAVAEHEGLAGLELVMRLERPGIALTYDAAAVDECWALDLGRLAIALACRGAETPELPVSALRAAGPTAATADQHASTLHATVPAAGFGPPLAEERECVHQTFLSRAARQPEAIAAIDERGTLTYGALRSRAAGLAECLRAVGVEPGDRVGVCLDASTQVPVALLGALLAGAAYVPMDPQLPGDRLGYLLEDSGARAVVTEAAAADRFPRGLPQLLVEQAPATATTPDVAFDPHALAYIVYTSGTTGWPKGVAIEHASLASCVRETTAFLDVAPGMRVLQHTSLGFDPATLEVFLALATGGTLIHAPRATVIAPGELEALIDRHAVDVWIGTPTLLGLVDPDRVPTLQRLAVGGEVMPPQLARRWGPGRRCFNVYGPSEGTVLTTVYRCTGRERESPPIGRPLPGRVVVVVDDELRPVAAGELGELCLGGLALARGYWERPELTDERFVELSPARRFYRTGDRGRMRSDGTLVFAGRVDRQVKVRGRRIELDEIEQALLSLPDVAEAAVALVDERLVAHVVGGGEADPVVEELRAGLARRLPSSMLPHRFVIAATLPRTINGKVATEELASPTSSLEGTLLALFRATLDDDGIGSDADFFERGGDSLDAVHVLTGAMEAGLDIPPALFYAERSAARLAAALQPDSAEAV